MARRVRKSRADNARWGQMVAALRLMNFAFNNVRLYPATHSEVVGSLNRLLETLAPVFQDQEDVGFGFMDELIYIEGSMSIEETANNQMLVDRFSKCRVEYLTFMKGVTLGDLTAFFQILNAEATKPTASPPSEQLAAKGVRTIHIVEAEVDDIESKNKLGRKKTLLDWYQKAVGVLQAAQEQIRDGAADKDLKPFYRLVDELVVVVLNKGCEPHLLLPLFRTGLDPHLAHAVNTAVLCCALGDRYGLNSGQINELCSYALLHDLGRLTIPVEWTEDHRPLGAVDRGHAAQHADWGFLLLTRDAELPPQAGLLAASHHEPGPMGAFQKILAMADAYELALYGDRYYWKKQPRHRILAHLLEGQTLLAKLLVGCVGYFPVGSLVRLEDGQRGLVVRPNPSNPGRPRVWLFEAPEPAAKEGEEPPPVIAELDEFDEAGTGFKRSIASVLDVPADLDLPALLDKKKEYLLNHAL